MPGATVSAPANGSIASAQNAGITFAPTVKPAIQVQPTTPAAAGYKSFLTQNVGAPNAPASSTTPAVQPTVLSSSNIDTVNQQNTQKVASIPPAGQTVENGFAINSDRSFAEAPSGAQQTTDADGNSYWTNNGVNYALGPSNGNVSDDPATQASYDALTQLKGQMDATSAATIGNIMGQYAGLITAQQQINTSDAAKTGTLLERGGASQSASTGGIIQAQISAGIASIATLNNKEQTAVLAAQQAAQDGDMKVLDEQLTIANQARTDKQTAAQKLSDTITTASAQAGVDSSVADLMSKGFDDPATIYSMLQAQGVNVTSAQVATALKNLSPTTAEKDKTSTVVVNGRRLLIDSTTGLTIKDLGVATGTVSLNGKSGSVKLPAGSPTTYTSPDDITSDTEYLKSHEGTDGYVDPNVYQSAFNTWTSPANGGTPAAFLKAFPPKDFVNPANTTLPSYLQSGTKKSSTSSTSTSDPFG